MLMYQDEGSDSDSEEEYEYESHDEDTDDDGIAFIPAVDSLDTHFTKLDFIHQQLSDIQVSFLYSY